MKSRNCVSFQNFPLLIHVQETKMKVRRFKEIEPEMPDNGGDTLGSRLTGSTGFFLAVSFFLADFHLNSRGGGLQ
jgi:hypothetical protein